jgi:hypothetical protein
MPGGMPVLSQQDVLGAGHERVANRYDFVTTRNRKGAAWAKVVLDIDDEEGVSGTELHEGHCPFCSIRT